MAPIIRHLREVIVRRRSGYLHGYEATQEIRRHEQSTTRHLPIIALTGYASPEDAAKCRQAGMDDVVTKPMTLPALREKLERLLALPAFQSH